MQDNWKNNIKDLMAERRISPHEESWTKLEKQLSTKEEKPKLKWWYFSGVAACLILVVGLFYLSSDDDAIRIVNNKSSSKYKINQPSPLIIDIPELNRGEDLAIKNNQSENIISETKEEKVKIIASNQADLEQKPIKPKIKSDLIIPEIIINKDTNQIKPEKKKYVSAEDLLASIEKEIKTAKSKGIRINEEELLAKIEDEIFEDKSTKFFDKIKNEVKEFLAVNDKIIN
ncbi:hypothetical protein KRX57_00975 [Weeksellaceae bacterium TAE3-ERU29]|nr:hypothetical protein [Weeksellaceae bacterium TAE3-ERU29]